MRTELQKRFVRYNKKTLERMLKTGKYIVEICDHRWDLYEDRSLEEVLKNDDYEIFIIRKVKDYVLDSFDGGITSSLDEFMYCVDDNGGESNNNFFYMEVDENEIANIAAELDIEDQLLIIEKLTHDLEVHR